ncbi:ATP-binding protein [Candidatus Parabeggiatoa sp. HSG14]|uniref:ATP-binding protein n=1 Tax=Candidatus Parabeggiatoa sp. HSG14 TaxID=3055593 RepID=UPI0025A69475|nr:AAA family ATPase [Thiotrichales bacterium HSG14]
MISINPYITGNPVGNGPAFIGRADVLREVLNVLKHPKNNAIVLVGQRRIGKTSVLHELKANLSKESIYHPIYFDLQDKSQKLLKELLQALANKISDEFQQDKLDLLNNPENTFHQWLQKLLNDLPQEKSLVLLLDEFDVIDDSGDKQQAGTTFFPYLRDLLDIDHQRLNFVFVTGRKIDDLSNIFLELFKGITNKPVSLLDHNDTVELIRLSEKNKTLNWKNNAIEKIWQLTNGHPYLTQHLCSRIWDNLIYDGSPGKQPPTATLKEVEKEVKSGDILQASENALEWLWGALPAAERIVASLLAVHAKPIDDKQLKDLLHKKNIKVITSDLRDAPTKLVVWDLIEVEKERYRFRVELLRRWVAEYKPINQLQEELAQIQSIANYLYALGEAAYNKNQADEAVKLLNKAIKTTPNHLEANLLLADVLLSRGENQEARKKLEKLYSEHSEPKVRDKLAQTLLNSAKKGEEEPYELYERVLELEPHLGAIVKWLEWEQLLHHLNTEEDYDTELKLALNLRQKYPEDRPDWQDYVEQLTKKQLYQSAINAIKNGDKETAVTQLKALISLSPTYQQASRYLYLADTGKDPKKLENSRWRLRFGLALTFIIIIAVAGGLFLHKEPLPFLPETYLLKEMEATYKGKEATYKVAQQQLIEIENEKNQLEKDLTQVRTSEIGLNKQVAQLEGERNQLTGERDKLDSQLTQAHTSEQALNKKVAKLEGKRDQLKGERDKLDSQLTQVRTSEQALIKQVTQLKGERNQLKEKRDKLDSELATVRISEQALTTRLTQVKGKRDKFKGERDKLDSELAAVRISEQAFKTKFAEVEIERDQIQGEKKELKKKLIDAQNGLIKAFLFSGNYIVVVGNYGTSKLANDELKRLNEELETHYKELNLTSKLTEPNKTTEVWWLNLGDSYSRESAEILRLWATKKLGVKGAYILLQE